MGWSAPAGRASAAPVQIVAPPDQAGTHATSPVRWVGWSAAACFRSFSFGIGIAFSMLIVVLLGSCGGTSTRERWENLWLLTPILAYPLVGMTTSRSTRRSPGSVETAR